MSSLPDGIEIHYLADKPHHARTCATWEYLEWGMGGGKTLDDALASFTGSQRDTLPVTLLACTDTDEPLGMVSLWASDCPIRPDITPWAASLYVAPGGRGRGLGTYLFDRIQGEARRIGFQRLHLMTQHSEGTYAALGWQVFERIDGPGSMRRAALMFKTFKRELKDASASLHSASSCLPKTTSAATLSNSSP